MKRLVFFSATFLLIFLFVANRNLFRIPERLDGDPQTLAEANRLYQDGDYKKSAEVYQQWVTAGAHDAALFYNLGNAYYKQGDIGRAILNFRRAQMLDPRDADIQANLSLARSQTSDRIDGENEGLGLRLSQISHLFAEDELALATLALGMVFVMIFMAYRSAPHASLWREGCLYGWIVLLILLVLSGMALASRVVERTSSRDGVVLASQVEVSSAPGGGKVQFVLHSGAEIEILEIQAGWLRVSLPGGNLQGWLPADSAEAVFQ